MYIGTDDIATNTISQYYLLNKTLKVTYDQNQAKGKDTKKYLQIIVDQYSRKKAHAKAANVAKGGQKKEAVETSYFQLETGNKDKENTTNINMTIGKNRSNPKTE